MTRSPVHQITLVHLLIKAGGTPALRARAALDKRGEGATSEGKGRTIDAHTQTRGWRGALHTYPGWRGARRGCAAQYRIYRPLVALQHILAGGEEGLR